MFSGMAFSCEICVVKVLLLGVMKPLQHSGIKRSENAINSQGYTILLWRLRASIVPTTSYQSENCGLSSVLRKQKRVGPKTNLDTNAVMRGVLLMYFTIPQRVQWVVIAYWEREN